MFFFVASVFVPLLYKEMSLTFVYAILGPLTDSYQQAFDALHLLFYTAYSMPAPLQLVLAPCWYAPFADDTPVSLLAE